MHNCAIAMISLSPIILMSLMSSRYDAIHISWCNAIIILVRSWSLVPCSSVFIVYGATLGHGSIIVMMQYYSVMLVPPWAKFLLLLN